jgi:hypothetical protein
MKWWRNVAFLSATATVLAWELVASFDGDPETMPWTDMIVKYVPGEVTAAAIGALCLWLPVHFGLRYYRQGRNRKRPPDPPTEG